jgi:hypothetical protein
MAKNHEASDVSPRWIAVGAGGLLLIVVVLSAGIYGYQHLFEKSRSASSLSDIERTKLLPPLPRLEADPEGDARAINAKADAALDSYGWIDRKTGIVHIPIDQAMQMLVVHGWPSRERQP